MNQLLTYPPYRDAAEEGRENHLQAKFKVKSIQKEHKKRENEFNSSMFQLKRKMKNNPLVKKDMDEVKEEETRRKTKMDEELEECSKDVYDGEIFLGYVF